MKYYKLHWLGGDTQIVSGPDIATAMNNVGYGHGALGALDYYENIKKEEAEKELSE